MKTLLAILLLTCTLLAHAGFYNGNDLNRWADADDNDNTIKTALDSAKLRGYVAGVVDAKFHIFCLPYNATLGQLVAVVKKYVRANPEKWDKPANIIVSVALLDAFPCKN